MRERTRSERPSFWRECLTRPHNKTEFSRAGKSRVPDGRRARRRSPSAGMPEERRCRSATWCRSRRNSRQARSAFRRHMRRRTERRFPVGPRTGHCSTPADRARKNPAFPGSGEHTDREKVPFFPDRAENIPPDGRSAGRGQHSVQFMQGGRFKTGLRPSSAQIIFRGGHQIFPRRRHDVPPVGDKIQSERKREIFPCGIMPTGQNDDMLFPEKVAGGTGTVDRGLLRRDAHDVAARQVSRFHRIPRAAPRLPQAF